MKDRTPYRETQNDHCMYTLHVDSIWVGNTIDIKRHFHPGHALDTAIPSLVQKGCYGSILLILYGMYFI